MKTVFLRILEADDKATALLEAVQPRASAVGQTRFEVDPKGFANVPRSAFAYWVSDRMRSLFKELSPFETGERTAKIGLSTSDDFRFVRLWWTAAPCDSRGRWVPFAKGGAFSPFFSDIYLLLNWLEDGRELKAWVVANPTDPRTVHWSRRVANPEYFFRPGLTWPLRTQRGFSLRAMPGRCIFGHKGPSVFTANDNIDELAALLAVGNSASFKALVDMQMAFGSYEVGVVQRTPVPEWAEGSRDTLADLARRAWSLKRFLDTCRETSHAFTLPALLQVPRAGVAACVDSWSHQVRHVCGELERIHSEIDERCFELYGIAEADRRAIKKGFDSAVPEADEDDAAEDGDDQLVEKARESNSSLDAAALAIDMVSWAVGVAFGRFDVRLATGGRELSPGPEPFDPQPVGSPGMLTGDDGLPTQQAPYAYPLDLPREGIMVDDAGHADDLLTRVRAVFDVALGVEADKWWQECEQLLGGDLRHWLARSYFEIHLKAYSRSRRRAPIYWQIATPTASYSVWLYAHAANADTLFRVLNDYVSPKLRHEERTLTNRIQEAGPSPSASQRKGIEFQRSFVDELRAFRGEVARVTPLWRPQLDDGVLVTCALTWRLVPQHRVWQRETNACWAKLSEGEYDWAHLAMHLWPERVVPKCASDRSLAIAHGLEDTFWVKDNDGKLMPRQIEHATVERLVQERSSAAVKAAVADLLAAG